MPGATPAKPACFLEHHADHAARSLITVNWDFGAPVTHEGGPLSSELGSMYPIYPPSSPPDPCAPSQRSWARPAERRNPVIFDWPRVGAHARPSVGFSSACALDGYIYSSKKNLLYLCCVRQLTITFLYDGVVSANISNDISCRCVSKRLIGRTLNTWQEWTLHKTRARHT